MANVTVNSTGHLQAGNKTVLKTSGGRIYVCFTNFAEVVMYKGNQDGEPTSFAKQDTNGFTENGLQDIGCASAIDGDDNIHTICYTIDTSHGGVLAIRYAIFNTGTDTWGTVEDVASLDNDSTFTEGLGIAIDVNNDPHVVWKDALTDMGNTIHTWWYANKISGWSTRLATKLSESGNNLAGFACDIMIANPTAAVGADRPIIAIGLATGVSDQINVRYGNALNATGWTEELDVTGAIVAGSGSFPRISMAIDSAGKITIPFNETGTDDLMVVEHLASELWSSWATPIDVDAGDGYRDPSIATIGLNKFIFAEDVVTNDIRLWKNLNYATIDGDAEFGTLDNSVIEDFTTFSDQTDANGHWRVNHNIAGKRVNITTELAEFDSIIDGSHDSIANQIGNQSDSAWITRFKLKVLEINAGDSSTKELWIGLGQFDFSLGSNSNQDFIGICLQVSSSISAEWRTADGDNVPLVVDGTFTHTPAVETLWIEITRLTTTTYRVRFYSDETYSTLIEEVSATCSASITALDNWKILNNQSASGTGNIKVEIDDIEFWDTLTEIPLVWVEETGDTDLPNVGTFSETRVRWAVHHNGSIGELDYVFEDNGDGIEYNTFAIATISEFVIEDTFAGADLIAVGKAETFGQTFSGADILEQEKGVVAIEALAGAEILLQVKDTIHLDTFSGADICLGGKSYLFEETISWGEILVSVKAAVLPESWAGADILQTGKDMIHLENWAGSDILQTGKSLILTVGLAMADALRFVKATLTEDSYNMADVLEQEKNVVLPDVFAGAEIVKNDQSFVLPETFAGSDTLRTVKDIIVEEVSNFADLLKFTKAFVIGETIAFADVIKVSFSFIFLDAWSGTDILEQEKSIILPETFSGVEVLKLDQSFVLADALSLADLILINKDTVLEDAIAFSGVVVTGKGVVIQDVLSGTDTIEVLMGILDFIFKQWFGIAGFVLDEFGEPILDENDNPILDMEGPYGLVDVCIKEEIDQVVDIAETINFADLVIQIKGMVGQEEFSGGDILQVGKDVLFGENINWSDEVKISVAFVIAEAWNGAEAIIKGAGHVFAQAFSGADIVTASRDLVIPDTFSGSDFLIKIQGALLEETFTGSDVEVITKDILIAEMLTYLGNVITGKSMLFEDAIAYVDNLITARGVTIIENFTGNDLLITARGIVIQAVIDYADILAITKTKRINDVIAYVDAAFTGKAFTVLEGFSASEILENVKSIVLPDNINFSDFLLYTNEVSIQDAINYVEALIKIADVLGIEIFTGTDVLETGKSIILPESFTGTDIIIHLIAGQTQILEDNINYADTLLTGRGVVVSGTLSGSDNLISTKLIKLAESLIGSDGIFIGKALSVNDVINYVGIVITGKNIINNDTFTGLDVIKFSRTHTVADTINWVGNVFSGRGIVIPGVGAFNDFVKTGKDMIFKETANFADKLVTDLSFVLNDIVNYIDNLKSTKAFKFGENITWSDIAIQFDVIFNFIGITQVRLLRKTTNAKILRRDVKTRLKRIIKKIGGFE